MVSTVALSQWGLGRKPGVEPIVGLLVFPTAIYRLSIWKPSDGVAVPFGLEHRVERTSDPLVMGWVLDRFLRDYEADYRRLKSCNFSYENPRPVLWSPINYDLERGLAPLRVTAPTNLGFLLRTNAKNLGLLIGKQKQGRLEDFCEEIPKDEVLIAKYLSALLVIQPSKYSQPIVDLVLDTIRSKEMLKLHEDLLHTLSEKDHCYAKLLREHVHPELPTADIKLNESDTLHIKLAERKEFLLTSRAAVQNEMAERQKEINHLKGTTVIKHPYIGVLHFCFSYHEHPLLIMRDMGVSLTDAMRNATFLSRWRGCPELRRRFAADIGESALNLAETPMLSLCHNDIRAPNIAVKDGASFCLLDFDLADGRVPRGATSCPVLLGIDNHPDLFMMFSVAQIALVVFALDVDAPRGAVEQLRRFWLLDIPLLWHADTPRPSGPDIPEFDAWLESKGAQVADVFWYRPSAGCEDRKRGGLLGRAHFVGILHAMLQ